MAGPGFGIIFTGFVVRELVPFHGLPPWQTGWTICAGISLAVAGPVSAPIRNHPRETGPLAFGQAQTTARYAHLFDDPLRKAT